MSKRADRRRRERHGHTSLRLRETSQLAHVVPRLAPDLLHQLIRDRGLDACGAIIAAATPQQVASLLDLDLWRTTPGRHDRFDERRFGAWIEMLMDAGETVATRVVADLDPSLAIAGLSHHLRVFDPGIFQPTASSDDDLGGLEVTTLGGLECEVGGYVVHARTPQAWEAIVRLLVTLANDSPDTFQALMEGCRRLSNSTPEADGLDDLMLEPEQWLHDVSVEREGRRSQQGYLAPGDAQAFLQMARQPRLARPDGSPSTNAIAAAYFRALGETAGSIDRELAFLANALMAGCSVYSRPFTAEEAWNAAVGICHLGLEPGPARGPEARVDPARTSNLPMTLSGKFLANRDLLSAFEAGWKLLYEDVSMFVARRLIATLADLRSVDPATERDLYFLRRQLERNRDAGTPWRASEALEVIGILDMPAWACLRGLLSECPVFPEALTAILEGHPGSVNATAFVCFTASEQIRKVHELAERLRDVLVC